MFRKTGEKMNVSKTLLLVVLVAGLFISAVSIARAVGDAYAFGYRQPGNLKGVRTYVWTGQPPDGLDWTAAPVFMYKTDPLKIVETGWINGTAGDLGDVLQQYIGYTDTDGEWKLGFHKGNLSEDVWYQFKVMYSQSADRWEAWRFNDVVWYQPYSLEWTTGHTAAMGSENDDDQGWMDAYGWHPEYRRWDGSWTLYHYTSSAVLGGGHIQYVYDWGYRAWGP